MSSTLTHAQVKERMKAALGKLGIPSKEIEVYGSQIVVTCWCRDSAEKFAFQIAKFAKVRGIVNCIDYKKGTEGTARPEPIKVVRVFACIQ